MLGGSELAYAGNQQPNEEVDWHSKYFIYFELNFI